MFKKDKSLFVGPNAVKEAFDKFPVFRRSIAEDKRNSSSIPYETCNPVVIPCC